MATFSPIFQDFSRKIQSSINNQASSA